jgi:hypothetical protein
MSGSSHGNSLTPILDNSNIIPTIQPINYLYNNNYNNYTPHQEQPQNRLFNNNLPDQEQALNRRDPRIINLLRQFSPFVDENEEVKKIDLPIIQRRPFGQPEIEQPDRRIDTEEPKGGKRKYKRKMSKRKVRKSRRRKTRRH